jgi:hypothetical protein
MLLTNTRCVLAPLFLLSRALISFRQFFLRGTQLSQLSDEYDTCFENISQTTKALHQKKECLPDLQTAFKEASARFDEASKAREQKKKADELKKELAWAHVAGKEAVSLNPSKHKACVNHVVTGAHEEDRGRSKGQTTVTQDRGECQGSPGRSADAHVCPH